LIKKLLFGGSGRLGKELIKNDPDIVAPTHSECDITISEQVSQTIEKYQPEIIIHVAALVGTKECETDKQKAWLINVGGTNNIVEICKSKNIRLIFISSAAIFDGKNGSYGEDSPPSPTFYYAETKVAGEKLVKQLDNYTIVRLDFFTLDNLKYNKVFIDHYTSKIPVHEAAAKIIKIANKLDFVGTINIGQNRNTLYNILKEYHPTIDPILIKDSPLPNFPRDISLNLTKWKKLFE